MADFQDLDHIDGVSVSTTSANLYNNDRDDLVLFYFRHGAEHASVYTQSQVISENIKWNKKMLMLPYSLRKDYISFTDKKWDWRYQFNKDGSPDINYPFLYEILPSGKVKAHYCQSEDKSSNV